MAAYLVGVARSYPLEGGTDLALACGLLICGIEEPVCREDEVRLA